MQEVSSDVIEIIGQRPGPTLAIFAGVHGNETAGIYALQEIIPELTISRGKLLIAFANPPAIKDNVRMHLKNLNRCFVKNNHGVSYEDSRARELMKVLDKSNALLDLHMFHDPEGKSFAICEDSALELANKFDVDIISTNWTNTEPGAADGYMYEIGKIGICVECGPIEKGMEYKEFAIKTIYQFLQYFEMLTFEIEYSTKSKRIIESKQVVVKESEDFELMKGFHNFDHLEFKQVIAKTNNGHLTANKNECIIFPRYNARIGEEAFIIGIEKLGV